MAKRKAKHDKAWEKTRDERVGTWRDFMQKSGKKAKTGGQGARATGGGAVGSCMAGLAFPA